MCLPKIYNWERIRSALNLLAERFPHEFGSWILIGGGACWFYRETLKMARDRDFSVPTYSAEEEATWLSKDLDFMGLTIEEAAELFQTPFKAESHTFSFEGLEVDFLEEGFRLTLRDARAHMREVHAGGLIFFVAAPELLFAEKAALLANKGRPQDRLHHALLGQFLKYEFCADLENAGSLEAEDWADRAREVKTVDWQFFANDDRFKRRLAQAVAALNPLVHKRIKHWARHHLPGYSE